MRQHVLPAVLAVALGWTLTSAATAQSVEPEFARTWEAAQPERPASIGPRGRFARRGHLARGQDPRARGGQDEMRPVTGRAC
jgi:hypothetical protein